MKFVFKTILILFFTLPLFTFGQDEVALDIKTREGEVHKTDYKSLEIDHRHGDNNSGGFQILLHHKDKGEYVIQHINADLTISQSLEMSLGKERIASSFVIGKRFHFITSVINKTTRQIVYKVYYSDDFATSFQEKEILNIPIDILGVEIGLAKFLSPLAPSFKTNESDKDDTGFISFSQDKNFFVISFDVFETKKDEHLFYVFNRDLELVFDASFESEEKDKNFNFIDVQVDNDNGTLYYLAKVIEKRSFLVGIRDYSFEIVRIDENSTSLSSFQGEDIYFGVVRLRLDRFDGTLKAIGTYSEKGDAFDRGVVFVDFNTENLANYNVTLSPFSDKFLELKFGNKKNKELKNYFLKGILQRNNGNFVLTSEEIRLVNFSEVNYYHFKDILVTEISSGGKLLKANHINKHQEINNLDYLPIASYSGFIKDNDTYLLFNAQKVKEKKDKSDLFMGTSLLPHKTFLVKIDEVGNTTYQQIEKSETRMLLASGESMYIRDNEGNISSMILQGQTMNKRQFIKIDILD